MLLLTPNHFAVVAHNQGERWACQADVGRREAAAVALGFLTAAMTAQPAHAIFGFGGPSKDEIYQRETVLMQLSRLSSFKGRWKAGVTCVIPLMFLCK